MRGCISIGHLRLSSYYKIKKNAVKAAEIIDDRFPRKNKTKSNKGNSV